MENTDHPRLKILESYETTIENCFRENHSQLKLVNYGTGSGKTYTLFKAICEAIKKHQPSQILGVYIAPLREHLQVPDDIKDEYPDIPMYIINSLEMKTTSEKLNLYKKWINSTLANKTFWKFSSRECSPDRIQENRKNLSKVVGIINQIEYLRKINFGDTDFSEKIIQKATWDLDKSIEDFLQFLIRYKPKEESWPTECLKFIEIFFPLHLLREKSGILLLTYKKFETSLPYFLFNGETWIKKGMMLDKYVAYKNNSNEAKFIIAFDEQEDGYQIMLDSMIDIISPQELAINNALSSISREFSALFSSSNKENRKLVKFIERNQGSLSEIEEAIQKNKIIDTSLQEFIPIYHRLIYEEGNSKNFLEQLSKINHGLEESLQIISRLFDEYNEEKHVVLDFEIFPKVFSKFENNRSLLIPYDLYNKIKDDLMNIFSYNNLFIYNIEPLKKLFLIKSSGGHVHISDRCSDDDTTLADLIYAILAIRLQIKLIEAFLSNVLDAADSQSRSLEIWAEQISKVQKASEDDAQQYRGFNKFLDRHYVYESYKSIINIMEISRYQNSTNNLINHDLREVSIGSTAIIESPEKKILSMIAKETSNVVFLISATGGILGDLCTSYDMRYLEDSLRDATGKSSFSAMTAKEVLLCEELRQYRRKNRKVSIHFFDQEDLSYPNIKTKELSNRFFEQTIKEFIKSLTSEGGWFGQYKKLEIKNFAYFLFYLFEDDEIQETIAFTQTLRWIKSLVHYCQKINHGNFIFQESPEHPDIYYVQVKHKTYQSSINVKLILYDSQFNSRYYDRSGQKTYLDELVEGQGQKLFFISAYQSAAKGLNPVIKSVNNETKDFDSLALLMDGYFTIIKSQARKSVDASKSEVQYHFSLMKSIVNLGNSNLEIKNFNKYLNQPEAEEFRRKQHQILLGKGLLQAIGRTERRDFSGQIVKVFINQESRSNLVNFYKYLDSDEPKEIRKLSVNNYEVYLAVQEEEKKRTIRDYDEHVDKEVEATSIFQSFREKMLKEIDIFHQNCNQFTVTKSWEALRDPIVFKNPATYLEKLKKTGLFPDEFIQTLFYHNPEQPEFTPYLAPIEYDGRSFNIVSDSINGKGIYLYQARLYPEYFKANTRTNSTDEYIVPPISSSVNLIYKLYNDFIPHPEIFNTYIPRPHFFYDVLYPSLSENFVKAWIKNVIFSGKDWKTIKSFYGFGVLQDFRKYNNLYERFDLFYVKGQELFCIDVKAWSQEAGNRLSQKTLEKAQKKLSEISTTYPEFTKVRGLLLNLHAPKEISHQYSSTLFSGNLIYFDDNYFPNESNVLKNFLFPKDT